MPGIADDCIAKLATLQVERSLFEPVWSDCIDLALPMHQVFSPGTFTSGVQTLTNGPKSEERGRKLYDSAGVMGVDRLSSGMESLVTPQSEKWHGIKSDDVFAVEQTQEETQYFEKYRDYLFTARYDNRSGFVNAHQKALRSSVALGTGVVLIEDCLGMGGVAPERLPFLYRYIPITRCYIAIDQQGNPDTLYIIERPTARVMAQRWGDKISTKAKALADDPKKQETRLDVLHAIFPRSDRYRGAIGVRNSKFQSCYIELETKHLIGGGTGGYYEFPAAIYYWHQSDESAYGESALMYCLAELKGLQVLGKTGLRIHQMLVDPPIASAHDGVKVRLNLNPRAVNYGAVSPDGQLLAKPIITATLPQVFNEYLQGKRTMVNDMLYVTLFQILVQNPGMTATEAMIRANEKGELLGPSGSKIQATMSHFFERETGILERKGIYLPGSPLEPPQSLSGRSFGPAFAGPLDRLRKMPELLGIQRTIEIATPLLEAKPELADVLDGEEIIRRTQSITGAPSAILVDKKVLAANRAAKAQQQAQMQKAVQDEQAGRAAQEQAKGLDASIAVGKVHGGAIANFAQQRAAKQAPPRTMPPGAPV